MEQAAEMPNIPIMTKDTDAPLRRADLAAYVRGKTFNKAEAVAWLKAEEVRAMLRSRTETDEFQQRASFDRAQACGRCRKSISSSKEENLIEEPINIDQKIHDLMVEILDEYKQMGVNADDIPVGSDSEIIEQPE